MTGKGPSFFLFACFFQDIQKRFVFFAALRTHVEVFTYEGHQLRCVLFVDFHLDVFVDPCIHLITGSILFPYAFEHAQVFRWFPPLRSLRFRVIAVHRPRTPY